MDAFSTSAHLPAKLLCVVSPGTHAVAVTTLFDLYGPHVEPWNESKHTAVKAAIVQAAGHGVTADNVAISLVATYSQQQQVLKAKQDHIKIFGITFAVYFEGISLCSIGHC